MDSQITEAQISEVRELFEKILVERGLVCVGRQIIVTISVKAFSPLVVKIDNTEHAREIDSILAQPISSIDFGVNRVNHLLENTNLHIVGDVARKSEDQMLKYRNFGRKALAIVQAKLKALGLDFNTCSLVGPLEHEAVLKSPIRGIIHYSLVQFFLNEQITTVEALLSKSVEDIKLIIPQQFQRNYSPKRVYAEIRSELNERGIL